MDDYSSERDRQATNVTLRRFTRSLLLCFCVPLPSVFSPRSVLLEFNRHLLSARPNPEVDVTEGTSSHAFRYTVLLGKGGNAGDESGG